MNHSILIVIAFLLLFLQSLPLKVLVAARKRLSIWDHRSIIQVYVQSTISSEAEDVTDSSDITTPAVDVIIQKKELAVVLAEVPDAKERRSVRDRVTQQPEESTDVPESSSPIFVAVVAKEVSAVSAVPCANAKDSSARAKEDGLIVV